MLFLESSSNDPRENLAREEYLFQTLPKGEEALFLWRNSPVVVIGRYQNAALEADLPELEKRGIPLVRRLSGGGAVYHDLGNLNYTIVRDCDDPDSVSLQDFTEPAVRACRRLGADAAFSGRNDILIGGKKLSGSAQYFREGRLLHHGCIMIATDLSVLPAILRPNKKKQVAGSERSVTSPVTTLSLSLGRNVSPEEFSAVLKEELAEGGEIQTAEDFWQAEEIARLKTRYEDPRWTFGYPPAYEETREERFPGGTVCLHVRMEEGQIAEAAFSGDFFCTGDIENLCALLRGKSPDGQLLELLRGSPEGRCIRGVTPDMLFRLITG